MHMQKERGYIVQEPSEKRFSGMRHKPRHAERPNPDFRDMSRCCAHFDGQKIACDRVPWYARARAVARLGAEFFKTEFADLGVRSFCLALFLFPLTRAALVIVKSYK